MKYLKPEGHPPLKFPQLILWRYTATLSAYVFLSLAYSLISLAFLVNFSGGNPVSSHVWPTVAEAGNPDAYGRATFLVYWALNFWGMVALGLASENVAMFIGMPWMGLWLIFWVITNVSTSFYDIDIEPRFYYWGYAWPLHHGESFRLSPAPTGVVAKFSKGGEAWADGFRCVVVQASRQILFDLRPEIGLNFGVLIAWSAVNTAIFPGACYWMRWKNTHGVHEYWA